MNYKHAVPDVNKAFSITCPDQTDLWDKPPSTHSSNAPLIYTTTSASALKSAAVTVDGSEFVHLYDQGGLTIIINLQDGSRRWIKAGIEMLEGQVHISVVVKDRWADWGLRPLLKPDIPSVRIAAEPHEDGALWIYAVDDQGTKHPIREVTWWGELEGDTEVLVGPAAARPSKETGDLIVKFSNLVVKTA
jgi:regulation of enolase protein 1 (concanavalin A-like superfamily)